MFPVLLHLGPVTVNTYGVMIAVGLGFAIWLSLREAKRTGIETKDMVDLAFWAVLSGLVGAHTLFAVVNFRDYMADPIRFLTFWRGGVVWYGGLLGGIVGGWIFIKVRRMDFWKTADVVAAPLAIGLFFGRFGCLSAGCCYGKPTTLPWAVIYPEVSQLAPPGIPLHPSPLYESLLMLAIYMALTVLRKRKRYHGQLFLLHVLFYSAGRFLLEMLRGDELRGSLFHLDLIPWVQGWEILSTSQAVSLLMLAWALAYMWKKDKTLDQAGTVARFRRILAGGA